MMRLVKLFAPSSLAEKVPGVLKGSVFWTKVEGIGVRCNQSMSCGAAVRAPAQGEALRALGYAFLIQRAAERRQSTNAKAILVKIYFEYMYILVKPNGAVRLSPLRGS